MFVTAPTIVPGFKASRRPDWRWCQVETHYHERRVPKMVDEYIYRGYMYYRKLRMSDPDKVSQNLAGYHDIQAAHLIHDSEDQYQRLRYIIEALILAGDSDEEIAAWMESLEPETVKAYVHLFYDVRWAKTQDSKAINFLDGSARNCTMLDRGPDFDALLKQIAVQYGSEGVKCAISHSRLPYDKFVEWLNGDIMVGMLHNAQMAVRSTNPGSERNLGLANLWNDNVNRSTMLSLKTEQGGSSETDPFILELRCGDYFKLDISPSLRQNGDMSAKEPKTIDLLNEALKPVEARELK